MRVRSSPVASDKSRNVYHDGSTGEQVPTYGGLGHKNTARMRKWIKADGGSHSVRIFIPHSLQHPSPVLSLPSFLIPFFIFSATLIVCINTLSICVFSTSVTFNPLLPLILPHRIKSISIFTTPTCLSRPLLLLRSRLALLVSIPSVDTLKVLRGAAES